MRVHQASTSLSSDAIDTEHQLVLLSSLSVFSASLVDVEVHVEKALGCGHTLAHEGTLAADAFSLSGVAVSHLRSRQHGRLVLCG